MNQNLNLVGDSSCGSSSLLLQSNSNVNDISWYSDSNVKILWELVIAFQTPVLNTSTTYYARGEMSFSNLFGGAPDNTIGTGDFFDYNQHLIFNNYSPSKLVSVLVFSDDAKYRTIELRNSNGNILQDTSIFIPNAKWY